MKIPKKLRYLLFLILTYVLIHVLMYSFQEKLLFLEKKLHADHIFNFQATAFEELFFDTKNGERINAIYFKTNETPKGEILYFHGNAGNLDRWGTYADRFTKQGYNILMLDYRGYGKSEGKPSEANFYEDGQLAYDWIRQKAKASDLIIYGRSIGTGVACQIAANNPAKLLILETPFNNMNDVARTRFPYLFLPFPLRHQFPNDEHIKKVAYPVLIFHGTKDKVVPYECAAKLKLELKETDHFYTIENGGHNNLNQFEIFNKTIATILQ